MRKYFFIIISMLLVNVSAHAQQYFSIQQEGFKGKVKRMIEYKYARIRTRGNHSEPVDTGRWESKYVYEYNADGNIERLTSVSNPFNLRKFTTITKYNIGKDSSTGFSSNQTGFFTTTLKIVWIDKTTYRVSAFDSSGKIITMVDHFLTDDLRKRSNELNIFGSDSLPVSSYRNEFFLNKEGLVNKEIRTDLKTNKSWTTHFLYKNFDTEGNPTEIYLSSSKKSNPTKIILREYQYY